MKKTRLFSVLLSLLILASAALFFVGALLTSRPASFSDFGTWLSDAVSARLRKIDVVDQLAPSLMLLGGAKEQDGIFITEDYLLENILPEDPLVLENNISGIESFLNRHSVPATVVLIPTAAAVKQQEIPVTADLYNQRDLISRVYSRLSGSAGTADAYTPLFSARDEYTYYRTASALTGLGGYYVYTALAPRLGLSPRPINQFEIEHLGEDYYGDLYERSSYKGIRPDLLTLYRFTRSDREYRLTCVREGEQRTYFTLFPTHLKELGHPEDAILGGAGQLLDISVVSPYADSILIFSDDTALSYLPFLVVHYEHITVINPARATAEQLAAVSPEDYDQVLFTYSVKTILKEDAGLTRLP